MDNKSFKRKYVENPSNLAIFDHSILYFSRSALGLEIFLFIKLLRALYSLPYLLLLIINMNDFFREKHVKRNH